MSSSLNKALNKLCKWRTVFAGWQLGTRPQGDPECDAVRDQREMLLLLRAEVNALTALLLRQTCTLAQYQKELEEAAVALDLAHQKRFPGFQTTDTGLTINAALAADTTKGWKP
jgi:hypothetical protein